MSNRKTTFFYALLIAIASLAVGMVLASRFLPGLRVAIPVACAYAGTAPLKFSVLNFTSALLWAGAIMTLVVVGSQTLVASGTTAWWGPFIPAVLVILFFRWLGRRDRKSTRLNSSHT